MRSHWLLLAMLTTCAPRYTSSSPAVSPSATVACVASVAVPAHTSRAVVEIARVSLHGGLGTLLVDPLSHFVRGLARRDPVAAGRTIEDRDAYGVLAFSMGTPYRACRRGLEVLLAIDAIIGSGLVVVPNPRPGASRSVT